MQRFRFDRVLLGYCWLAPTNNEVPRSGQSESESVSGTIADVLWPNRAFPRVTMSLDRFPLWLAVVDYVGPNHHYGASRGSTSA